MSNTVKDDGVLAETEETRGMKKLSLEAPMCGGKDKIVIEYHTMSDDLAFKFWELITTKMGISMTIEAKRKGGGGP